ncbi:putative nucleic acid-binding Zn-ribbon protein [Providencia alcalifaciens]|nr:putative nucleic acid-binding Zn-ribbon protein [Providencia alcalifaciens]
MAITLEQRKAELAAREKTQGIGENKVLGGNALNRGYNKGIIEGGIAYDGGMGNGNTQGGSATNNNINEDTVAGGAAFNRGVNNGDVGGGDGINDGINKNTLLGGMADNNFGSINQSGSFIKGGDAIRELQRCVESYDGHLIQLKAMQDDYAKIKGQIEIGQTQSNKISHAEQEKLENLLIEKNDEINKLNDNIKNNLNEIQKLTSQSTGKDEIVKAVTTELEEAIKQKNELIAHLADVENKKLNAFKRIETLKESIEQKNKEVSEYQKKLEEHGADKDDLNKKISTLQSELKNKETELNNNQKLVARREKTISKLNTRILTVEVEYNQKQDELKKQLEEVMNQISALAKEGKNKLSDSVTVTAGSKITASTVETTTTIDDESSTAPSINGGNVRNTGTNTGLIKAGDSNSHSIVVNTEINIDKGNTSDLVVSNLVESMSGMTSKAEGIITDVIGSVDKNTKGVVVFAQNSSNQVVC